MGSAILTFAKKAFASLSPAWLTLPWLGLAVWLFAHQIETLSFPIIGEHRWRQSDVYSVAYNFAHESADFFHPRIDWARNRSGVMGMEPPVLGYLAHVAMRFFGDDPMVARWTAWLMCALGLSGFLLGAGRLLGARFAVLLFGSLALSPMALYELRQIQPDAAMSLFAAAAAMLLAQASQQRRRGLYVVGLVVYTFAVLLKGPVIVLAPAMLWFALSSGPLSVRRVAFCVLPFLVPLALFGAWQAWAAHLNQSYNAGKVYFAMVPDASKMLKDIADREALRHIFWFLYPTYVSNWVMFPATCAGLVAAFTGELRRVSAGFVLWLLLASAFLAAFSSRLGHHWYYADLALPPMVYFGAHGLLAACELFAPRAAALHPLRSSCGLFALLSLALAPLLSSTEGWIAHLALSWGVQPAPSWTPPSHLVLLLVALAISAVVCSVPSVSRRVRFGLAVVALGAAASLGIPRGARDAVTTLEQRSDAANARTYREKRLLPLRAAIDRFSTRADRVVTNRQDPSTLHEVLRKGYAVSPQQLNRGKLAWFKRKKAKLYVHFGSRKTLPPELQSDHPRYPLLRATRDFRIYCLQAECPEQAPGPGG
jgi:4-amino-4-deoxy-L-arabinose transferase-like glycosyltransferase